MPAAPDSPEFAASPDAPRRVAVMSAPFWAMMILAGLCLLGAALVVSLGPGLFAGRPSAAPPASIAAPLPSPQVSPAVFRAMAPQPGPLSGDPGGLDMRVARLETAQGRLADAATMALAVAVLTQAADQPRPFAQLVVRFQEALPGGAALALTPLALQGAPTRLELAQDLSAVASAAAVEARAPGRNSGLGARIAYIFSRLVSVRRLDPGGSGPEGIISRAEISAASGDTETALALINQLPPQARPTLANWRQAAQRRIAIDDQIGALQAGAVANLAAARGPAS